jgi:hypothetical protein
METKGKLLTSKISSNFSRTSKRKAGRGKKGWDNIEKDLQLSIINWELCFCDLLHSPVSSAYQKVILHRLQNKSLADRQLLMVLQKLSCFSS